MVNDFINYLKSKLGNVYVWGAQGQVVSSMADPEAWITKMEKKNGQSYVDRALKFYRQTKASGKHPIEAYDCSGLIMYYLQNLKGIYKNDMSADSLYKKSVKITKEQLQRGNLVFIYNKKKSKMGHVGVYIGDGMTIEAYGRDKGVIELPLSKGEWTHYGRLEVLGGVQELAEVIKLTSPMMRGEPIRQLQIALNGLGYPCGEADGIAGAKTIAALEAFVAAHSKQELPKQLSYTLTVGDKTASGVL